MVEAGADLRLIDSNCLHFGGWGTREEEYGRRRRHVPFASVVVHTNVGLGGNWEFG